MQASHELARESHASALKMEAMTGKMGEVAEKTRVDTASMKTITTVTLFFLPGTFISVSTFAEVLLRRLIGYRQL